MNDTEENYNLTVAKNYIEECVKEPDKYLEGERMVEVTKHLESFCNKSKDKEVKEKAKAFNKINKMFRVLDKDKKKNFSRMEVFILKEDKKNIKFDKELDCYRYVEIMDLKKNKGEKLELLEKLDGTITLTFSGINIQMPKNKFEHLEEVRNE